MIWASSEQKIRPLGLLHWVTNMSPRTEASCCTALSYFWPMLIPGTVKLWEASAYFFVCHGDSKRNLCHWSFRLAWNSRKNIFFKLETSTAVSFVCVCVIAVVTLLLVKFQTGINLIKNSWRTSGLFLSVATHSDPRALSWWVVNKYKGK